MLLDENRKPFFPLVTTDTIVNNNSDKTLQELFADRYTKEEVDQIIKDLGTLQRICGTLATASELPETANPGDTYIVTEDSSEYMYIGDRWEKLGPLLNLSPIYIYSELSSVTI